MYKGFICLFSDLIQVYFIVSGNQPESQTTRRDIVLHLFVQMLLQHGSEKVSFFPIDFGHPFLMPAKFAGIDQVEQSLLHEIVTLHIHDSAEFSHSFNEIDGAINITDSYGRSNQFAECAYLHVIMHLVISGYRHYGAETEMKLVIVVVLYDCKSVMV